MESEKKEKIIQDRIEEAIEAPIHDDQRDIEASVLATLAEVINSDVSELKYSLLELDAVDFYFQDHRDSFATMKALSDLGDHVDQLTVQEKGAPWPDPSKAKPAAAVETYKRRIIARSNIRQAAKIGREYLDAVQVADPDDLPGLVASLQKTVFDIEKTRRFAPQERPEADLIEDFILELRNPKPGYMTGFSRLDSLTGGLKPGVFIIAAPPSAGKTTFVKQLADQVAELNEGTPVLFLSYEQSAAELRTKTLARLSRKKNQLIREGKIEEKDIADAIRKYLSFGHRLKIVESDFQHNIGTIRLLAQREKLQADKAPAILIDYLQVMPVANPALKDKRAEVDFLVSELRRLARDIGSPIIAVSSMPRSEYKNVKMSGFKESGGIEYGTDVAAIMDVKKESGGGLERSVNLAVIKNRNGQRKIIRLRYEMVYDTFKEEGEEELNYLESLGVDHE